MDGEHRTSAADRAAQIALAGVFVALLAYAAVAARAGSAAVPALWSCPLRALAGIPCPGCGLTRALVAALRGDLAASLRFHPLGPVVLATLAWLAWHAARGLARGERLRLSAGAGWTLLAVLGACWVAKLLAPPAAW